MSTLICAHSFTLRMSAWTCAHSFNLELGIKMQLYRTKYLLVDTNSVNCKGCEFKGDINKPCKLDFLFATFNDDKCTDKENHTKVYKLVEWVVEWVVE